MRDSEMAAAIAAGDPAGLDAAYDRYAAVLYAYCCSLLAEPADAADAVADTFVVAVAKLARLGDRDLVRAWLYAVARNECQRRLRGREAASPDGMGEPAGVHAGAGRSEPHELVDAAIAGLDPDEHDVVELNLRHDVDDAGLAATFGVSRHQARALASRARKQFEASLGALLVARAGPEFCPDLGALLAGWDGELTAALRKRLGKHIKRCQVCGERQRRKLRPAMLLGLPPVPALPNGLRRQVLGPAADASPDGAANRAHIARRAEPFGRSGFPVPLDPPKLPPASTRSGLATVTGVALLVLLGTGTVIVTGLPGGGGADGSGPVLGVQTTRPAPAQQVPPAVAGSGPTTTSATGHVAAGVTTSPAPTAALPSASATPAVVAPGTLTVSTTTVRLRRPRRGGPPTGSFTLTANGGPVAAFAITVPAAYAGDLTVTPTTGSLADGQSVLVRVTLRSGYNAPLYTKLSVEPGGLTVTVVYRPPPR